MTDEKEIEIIMSNNISVIRTYYKLYKPEYKSKSINDELRRFIIFSTRYLYAKKSSIPK